MKFLTAFWRYWKFVCVALTTTLVVLFLVAAFANYLKSSTPDKNQIGQCLDNGGTWDDNAGLCKAAG